MKKKIAIIGAGISGLTFGNLLKQSSKYNFTIYEKKESLELNKGYGIQIATNGISILNKIGFKDYDVTEKFHPKKIDFYSIQEKKICDLDLTQFNFNNENYTTLKRSNLMKFLKENLFTNDIQFNKNIEKFNYINSKIEIIFEDKSSDIVDYIVICDGVFSKIKSIIFNKKNDISYYGSIAIRQILDKEKIKFLNKQNISIFLGPNLHAVLYPINEKFDFNFISIVRKKLHKDILKDYEFFKNKKNIKEILNETLIKKHNFFAEIFNNEQNLECYPVYCSKRILTKNIKNIFFLGDSFFTYPPSFAQGASQSIESAFKLFELLDSNKSFKKYYNERIKVTNMINRRSKLNYYIFHLSNKILVKIRDIILKVIVTNKLFLRKYLARIYLKD